MRYLLRYTLLPLAAALLSIPALAQDRRAWWYPQGTPEGTRHILLATRSQTEKDIRIKWRTSALKNSPVLLAGALDRRIGANQQIVGMSNNVLTILSDSGTVNQTVDYSLFTSGRAMLTGLFNPELSTTVIGDFPTLIGIGVEARPGAENLLRAFLADPATGTPTWQIHLPVTDTRPGNRLARLQPVAAFTPYFAGATPMVLAIASMDGFQYEGVRPENGLRRYHFGTAPATVLDWTYQVAPMVPEQAGALSTAPDVGASGPTSIALNTESYTAGSRFATAGTRPTSSDSIYSIALGLNNPTAARHFSTDPMPTPAFGPTTDHLGVVKSYIESLFRLPGSTKSYRIITENHDAARPGEARISLALDTVNGERQGHFTDPAFPARNVGWTIVTADIDGSAPTGKYSANNPGNEIIAAWSALDGSDLDSSWLYVLGTSLEPAGDSLLTPIARQLIRGRLMAAGDLVKDPFGRSEIVLVHRDTLWIMQLEGYDKPDFDPSAQADRARPFRVVKSFVLDAPIVSVALADIEGDLENDILVSTELATYAIGIPRPDPFGVIAPSTRELCRGESLTVNWGRWVGSAADEVKLVLSGPGGPRQVPASRPVTAPGTLTFSTKDIPAGRYRLLVQDFMAPEVADSSVEIIINPHEITDLRATDGKAVYALGDSVHLAGTANCFDGDVTIVRQVGTSGPWETIPAIYPKNGSSYGAAFELNCPETPSCTPQPNETFRFVFISSDGTLESDTVELRVENLTKKLVVTPSDSSSARRRVVSWEPSEYGCDSLSIVMLRDGAQTEIAVVPTMLGSWGFDVRDVADGQDVTGSVILCAHCSTGADLLCATGRGEFEVLPLREAFVAPNPFDPGHGGNDIAGTGALINFMLDEPERVTVTIYDASRAVVRRLAEGIEGKAGSNSVNWDGRNSLGEIVASGAYICVVELDSREPIILPIVVVKQR